MFYTVPCRVPSADKKRNHVAKIQVISDMAKSNILLHGKTAISAQSNVQYFAKTAQSSVQFFGESAHLSAQF
jgi:hypothetical protein